MTDALINPPILSWARDRADLDQIELAEKVGVKPEKILQWKEGEGKPTFKQAQKLARILRVPFGYLFLSTPPETTAPIPDLRTLGNSPVGQFSLDLEDLVSDILNKQAWYRDYLLERGAVKPSFIGRFSVEDSITSVAADLTDVLRLVPGDRKDATFCNAVAAEVLAPENNLRERWIVDEAHSSQSGRTAGKLKAALTTETPEEVAELSAEDLLNASVESRRVSPNLSYYAFTATPKAKTLELFGRLPNPAEAPSKKNKPEAFHVYSMRQAIEEEYILDVLKNYTDYDTAYKLAQKAAKPDVEVDKKKAKIKLNQWVRLHPYNIGQKVMVIVEHFCGNIMGLLGGQAKAMVATSSRKEAVRYKLEFDKYVRKKKYDTLNAMVAFSGEVTFRADDPNSEGLAGEKFTETGMNPGLKGRDMSKAFDARDYHVMIVANKFQTGFDQPKLCAMYVDKKLGGLECVQTLSRLNRLYPGKQNTYIVDFFNKPDEVLAAFQEYYHTAKLLDVSDPNRIWDLYEKLKASRIFTWAEVENFNEAYLVKSKSNAAISNICKPAADRWLARYEQARKNLEKHKDHFDRVKSLGDPQESASGLYGGDGVGTGKARSKEDAWLSEIIKRLNE